MQKRKVPRALYVALVGGACAVMVGAVMSGMPDPVHAQQTSERQIELATYDPQAVFSESPMQQSLKQAGQEVGAAMQKAQQQGDRQAMQQLQAQFRQAQQRAFQNFEQAVRQVAPGVAEAEGVRIIAADVVYQDDAVAITDVSSQIVEELKATSSGAQELGIGQPQQQQQQRALPAPQ